MGDRENAGKKKAETRGYAKQAAWTLQSRGDKVTRQKVNEWGWVKL